MLLVWDRYTSAVRSLIDLDSKVIHEFDELFRDVDLRFLVTGVVVHR